VAFCWLMCIEMKDEMDITKGTTVEVDGMNIVVTGPKGELRRVFSYPGIKLSVEGGKVVIEGGDKRTHKRMINTFTAHINNMMKGVTEGFEYRLKVCFVHFPISLKKQGTTLIIENFMGEKKNRSARLMEGVEVEIKGNDLTVHGIDKERVSQTAANIEQACRVKRYDRRVFQDGIYLVSKGDES
jgi:large subunit ribosomal protein L6